MPRQKDHPAQLPLLFAPLTILPGAREGEFIVRQGKPVALNEVGPAKAAQILKVAKSSLSNLLERPLAQKHIRWRWLSDARGKRLFDAASLYEYRKATQDAELPKGQKVASV